VSLVSGLVFMLIVGICICIGIEWLRIGLKSMVGVRVGDGVERCFVGFGDVVVLVVGEGRFALLS